MYGRKQSIHLGMITLVTLEECWNYLYAILWQLRVVYIMINGVDECDESTQLVSDLLSLSTESEIRLLLTSRPEKQLCHILRMIPQISISRDMTKDDPDLYVRYAVKNACITRKISIREDRTKEKVILFLTQNADEM